MDRYWNGRALSGEEEASRGGLGSPHRGTHPTSRHGRQYQTSNENEKKRFWETCIMDSMAMDKF